MSGFSNFDFLKEINESLYILGKDAEIMQVSGMKQYVPNTCRQFIECIIYDLCEIYKKNAIMSENSHNQVIDLFSTIKVIKKEINEDVGFKIDNLRIICNRGSHYQPYLEDELTDGQISQIVQDIYYIARWYAKSFYKVGSQPYDVSLVEPINATKTELDNLRILHKEKIRECEEWKQDYEDSEKRINELTNKLKSSIKNSSKTIDNKELILLKKQNDILEEQIYKTKDALIQIKTKLYNSEERNKYLTQKHNEVVIAYNKKSKDVVTKDKAIEILKEKNENLNKEKYELKALIDKYEEDIKQLGEKATVQSEPTVIYKTYSKEENYKRFLENMKNTKFGSVKYNELAFDVLSILVKFDRLELNFITKRQIFSFLAGENTPQINLFKLYKEELFGKYKEENKSDLNRKIYQILKIWTSLKAISNPQGLIDVLI